MESDKLRIIEKDKLKKLFKDIKYQTEYMTGSWGDSNMLSRMAREDKISPWSIEEEINKFCKENDINLDEKTCVICEKEFTGWGNNPEPIKNKGECCDKCDNEKVIPARLEQLNG